MSLIAGALSEPSSGLANPQTPLGDAGERLGAKLCAAVQSRRKAADCSETPGGHKSTMHSTLLGVPVCGPLRGGWGTLIANLSFEL